MPNRGHKEGNQIMRAATAALTLALVASAVAPATTRASAAAGFVYTLSGANATVTGCETVCPNDLIIPSTLAGHPVTTIGANAFDHENLTSVTIPNTVTEISDYAFDNSPLPSVSIPNSVVTIGSYAFSGNQLTSVTIPNSVQFIGAAAFFSNRLTSATIGTSVLQIGGDSFAHNSLTTITIPSSVFDIGGYAFAVNALESVLFLGDAPSDGSGVVEDNPSLMEVGRYSSATGWMATWGGKSVATYPSIRAAASIKPTVTGTARIGGSLTAAKGTWSGTPTPSFTYQWYSCTKAVSAARTTVPSTCKKITGATRSTFKLTTAQRGKYVAVLVKGTTHRMTPTSWLSKTTAKVR
jgi:hypothetical protein